MPPSIGSDCLGCGKVVFVTFGQFVTRCKPPALVDYLLLRPALNPVVFSGFYVVENLAYQLGVALGCLRRRTTRPLLPRVRLV